MSRKNSRKKRQSRSETTITDNPVQVAGSANVQGAEATTAKRKARMASMPPWLTPLASAAAVIGLFPLYHGNCAQSGQLMVQQEQLKVQQEQLELNRKQQDSNTKHIEANITNLEKQIEETRRATLSATFHSVLSDIASDSPERRFAGISTARTFIEDKEYRQGMAVALIELLGKRIREFSDNKGIPSEEINPYIGITAKSILASKDCKHLEETIHGIYNKMNLSGNLPAQIAKMSLEEQKRREDALGFFRINLGVPLFCSFLPYCANRVDFWNIVNGDSVVMHGQPMPDTTYSTMEDDTFTLFSGYAHEEPGAGPDSWLYRFVANCSSEEIDALRVKACSWDRVLEAGEVVETNSCRLLKKVRKLPGGLTGFGDVSIVPLDGSQVLRLSTGGP
jgi:hypothetical protein